MRSSGVRSPGKRPSRTRVVGVTRAGATCGAALAVVLLAACSSGSPSPQARRSGPAPRTLGSVSAGPAVSCPPAARAWRDGGGPGGVHTASSGSAGFVTCIYRVTAPRRDRCRSARVTIDTAPSAMTDFNRWVDETEQNSSAGRTPREAVRYAPHAVTGIGVGAAWVPALLTFEAARATRWVSVFLTCPQRTERPRALAEALARAGLDA